MWGGVRTREGRPGLGWGRMGWKEWLERVVSYSPVQSSGPEEAKHGFALQQATTRTASVCLVCDYHNSRPLEKMDKWLNTASWKEMVGCW